MADNVTITPGVGATVAADDVGGVLYQRVKPAFGADGSASDVSAASPLPVAPGTASAVSSTTQVSAATSTTQLLASNSSARARIVVNDSAAVLYLKFGATASSSSYTYKVGAGETLEFPAPLYTGVVHGIWASASGVANVTEV